MRQGKMEGIIQRSNQQAKVNSERIREIHSSDLEMLFTGEPQRVFSMNTGIYDRAVNHMKSCLECVKKTCCSSSALILKLKCKLLTWEQNSIFGGNPKLLITPATAVAKLPKENNQ